MLVLLVEGPRPNGGLQATRAKILGGNDGVGLTSMLSLLGRVGWTYNLSEQGRRQDIRKVPILFLFYLVVIPPRVICLGKLARGSFTTELKTCSNRTRCLDSLSHETSEKSQLRYFFKFFRVL